MRNAPPRASEFEITSVYHFQKLQPDSSQCHPLLQNQEGWFCYSNPHWSSVIPQRSLKESKPCEGICDVDQTLRDKPSHVPLDGVGYPIRFRARLHCRWSCSEANLSHCWFRQICSSSLTKSRQQIQFREEVMKTHCFHGG